MLCIRTCFCSRFAYFVYSSLKNNGVSNYILVLVEVNSPLHTHCRRNTAIATILSQWRPNQVHLNKTKTVTPVHALVSGRRQLQDYFILNYYSQSTVKVTSVRNGQDSSVGRAWDRKARRNANASSVRFSGAAKGFSPSQLSVKTLALNVSVQPPCAIACINMCADVKNPRQWQPHAFAWAHKNTAHVSRNA